MSDLPKISASWSSGKKFGNDLHDIRKVKFDYKKEPYFAMIAGAYVASYLCGITMDNVNSTVPIIASIARYHLYFHINRFMKHPELLDKYNLSTVQRHIPTRVFDVDSTRPDSDGNMYVFDGHKEHSSGDYLYFIAKPGTGRGITPIGMQLLQESIESMVYCVLGAQADTRWSIVNKGAKSLQTHHIVCS